jgi:hypothetical protein
MPLSLLACQVLLFPSHLRLRQIQRCQSTEHFAMLSLCKKLPGECKWLFSVSAH